MSEYRMYGNPTYDKNGRELIEKMNVSHRTMGDWFYNKVKIDKNDIALEVGCGGGVNVKRLALRCNKVIGIDISEMSKTMSIEKNLHFIKKNKVEIYKSSIEDFKYDDNYFSLITAFETIYFWTDIEKSFNKINKLLKNNGRFYLIFNSLEDQKTWPETPLIHLIDEIDMVNKLKNQNFKEVNMYRHKKEAWIIIEAIK